MKHSIFNAHDVIRLSEKGKNSKNGDHRKSAWPLIIFLNYVDGMTVWELVEQYTNFPSKLAALQNLNELEAKHYIKVGVE